MKAEEMVARLGGAIRGIAREAGREVAALGGAAAFQGEWFEPGDEVVPGRDVRTCVTEVGSLGSKVVTFETDAETVAAIARLDLSGEFGPVLLDPGHGIVSLTRPSVRHERLVAAVDEWLREAICARGEAVQSLRGVRLRGPAEPPGTGVEAAGAFYIGESARGYHEARRNGEDAARAFVLETPPELVVEIEETAADDVKTERYTELGVTELWRVRRRAVWTESDPERGGGTDGPRCRGRRLRTRALRSAREAGPGGHCRTGCATGFEGRRGSGAPRLCRYRPKPAKSCRTSRPSGVSGRVPSLFEQIGNRR